MWGEKSTFNRGEKGERENIWKKESNDGMKRAMVVIVNSNKATFEAVAAATHSWYLSH